MISEHPFLLLVFFYPIVLIIGLSLVVVLPFCLCKTVSTLVYQLEAYPKRRFAD